jgi:hypothetical protein
MSEFSKNVKTIQSDIFHEFLKKLALMTKESLLITLRNPSRQRRTVNRFFVELGILIQEAVLTHFSFVLYFDRITLMSR